VGAPKALAPTAEALPSPVRSAITTGVPDTIAEPERYAALTSLDELSSHIAQRATGAHGAARTMVVGSGHDNSTVGDARDLALTLADAGRKVIIVEWSTGASRLVEDIGADDGAGMSELLSGAATFEDVIRRLPGSEAHFLTGGGTLAVLGGEEAERVNLVLDALDEAYDHILITGDRPNVKRLFEIIQGRIDTGVLIDAGGVSRPNDAAPGTFLGYDVTDIDVVRLDPNGVHQSRRAPKAARNGSVAGPQTPRVV
ncbi:MAG TPA: hypothetical protein PK264_03110, partial [Hyphomicrobiaceae bacterium]|nr:hypothetical protein [Hyphomicrobiaceae bacterium]